MESRTAFVLLGLAALFLGGLSGGLLGTALLGRPQAKLEPVPAKPDAASGEGDRELARALVDLSAEIRGLRSARGDAGDAERKPAVGEEGAPASDADRLEAALDRLSGALELAQGRASPGGIGITPLALPASGSRLAALEALVGHDWQEISREYRFWTFQQVLDRFGHPDRVENERWIYLLPRGDDEEAFSFQFTQGYLMNIYD